MKANNRVGAILRPALLYSLLLGGSVIFSLPFVYMIGTSFKMDREMSREGIHLLPERPIPASHSPYIDRHHYEVRETALFEEVRPIIESALTGRNIPLPPQTHGRETSAQAIAPGIFQRLWQITPRTVWELPPNQRSTELLSRISDDMIAEVARNSFRRLALGTVRARSLDLQEADLTAPSGPAAFWTLESGPGELHPLPSGERNDALLAYSFSGRGRETIRLTRTVSLPFDAARLARLQIAIQPDDSWNEFTFAVEMNGHRYEALRTQHLGGHQPMVVTFQEEGPADRADSLRLKLWIPFRKTGPAPDISAPREVRLILELRQNGQADAWQHKAARNYRRTLDYVPIWRYAATSTLLVLLNIVGNVFSCSLAAYAFARLQWPGRNLGFGLMLATMMIPPQISMIPFFLIIKWLGWYNTLTPLWAISFFGNAFNIFLLRQFMKGIPRDLEDAARIDGCNFLQVYWHVIMPLIKPTLACIAVFTFVGVWNDFMGPLIFLADQRLYPLSLGLYAFQVQEGGSTGMMMAASLLMTIPVIVIFFFAQRYFIQGITLSGMKG